MVKDRLARGRWNPAMALSRSGFLVGRMRKIPTGHNCGVELEPCYIKGRKLTAFIDEFSEDFAGMVMALLFDHLSGHECSTSIRIVIHRYLRGRYVQREDFTHTLSCRERVRATAGLAHCMAFPLRLALRLPACSFQGLTEVISGSP